MEKINCHCLSYQCCMELPEYYDKNYYNEIDDGKLRRFDSAIQFFRITMAAFLILYEWYFPCMEEKIIIYVIYV